MNDAAAVPLLDGAGIGFMMFKSLGMLCLVLGLLIGILFVIKRMSQSRSGFKDKAMIRQMSTFHMSPKEKVVLLDVMGKHILIGVTPQSITHISDIDPIREEEDPARPTEDPSLFKSMLSRLTQDHPSKEDDKTPSLNKLGASS